MIDAPAAHDLEILGVLGGLGFGVIEGVDHAHAFDRLLRDPVDHIGLWKVSGFQDRRHYVNHVVELLSDLAPGFDALRPAYGHAVAGTAKVGGDLLGPLKWCVHGPSPTDGIVG